MMEELKQTEKREPKIVIRDGAYWTEDGKFMGWKLTEEQIREAVEANPREAELYRQEGWTDEQYAEMVYMY